MLARTAGFPELVDIAPGGLNESNISDLVDAGVFDAYKKSLQKTVDRLSGAIFKERLVVIYVEDYNS